MSGAATVLTLTTKGQRVAIAGQVIDATTQRPIAGARVELGDMPEHFQQRLRLKALQYGDRWEGLQARCDRTHTAPDGLFYFTNLPEGHYTLVATAPPPGTYASQPQTVTVASSDPQLLKIALTTGDRLTAPPAQPQRGKRSG